MMGQQFARPTVGGRAAGPLLPTECKSKSLVATTHRSIAEIPRHDWVKLFPESQQSWDYYAAGERMSTRRFSLGAISAYCGDTLVGAAPMFRVEFRLDEPLGAPFQIIGRGLHHVAPSLIAMPILGLGSPIADECHIGILPGLDKAERREVLLALLDATHAHARAAGIRVLALKDVTEADHHSYAADLEAAGFSAVPSLPIASLALPFSSLEEYLMSLSPSMRQDVRRKMRQASEVRVEYRDNIEGIEQDIVSLHAATRANRKASYDAFDELPGGYFRELMIGLGGAARLQLLWIGDTLAAFNLFIVERDRVVGKYLGMRYPLARQFNLYFANWIAMVRYCIENHYRELNVGQTSYALKVRLGCTLHRSWIHVKHTGFVRGPLFRLLAPFAAFDRMDPELRKLGSAVVYAHPDAEAD